MIARISSGHDIEKKAKGIPHRLPVAVPDSQSCNGRGIGARSGIASLPRSPSWLDGLVGQKLDLAHQETLLVRELIIFGAILQELGQKFQETLPVVDENALHGHGFIGIRHKHLQSS